MKASGFVVAALALLLAAAAPTAAADQKDAPTPDEVRALKKAYRDASPDERRSLRRNAGELRRMTPEERQWAVQNQDAMRELGSMPNEDRKALIDLYRQLPPEQQKAVREAR